MGSKTKRGLSANMIKDLQKVASSGKKRRNSDFDGMGMGDMPYEDPMFEDGLMAADEDAEDSTDDGATETEEAAAYAQYRARMKKAVAKRRQQRKAEEESDSGADDSDDATTEDKAEAALDPKTIAFLRQKGYLVGNKVTKAGWAVVNRVAEGEAAEESDEDEDKADAEAAQALARKNRDKARSAKNAKNSSTKRRQSFGDDFGGMGDPLLDDPDDDLMMDTMIPMDDMGDDMVFGEDEETDVDTDTEAADEETADELDAGVQQAAAATARMNSAYRRKIADAMRLAGMMRLRGMNRSPMTESVAGMICAEFPGVSKSKAKVLARRAMMLGYQKEISGLITEADALVAEYPASQDFLKFQKRIASMDIPDQDQIIAGSEVESWDTSDTFNNSYTDYKDDQEDQAENKSARQASQQASASIDDILSKVITLK